MAKRTIQLADLTDAHVGCRVRFVYQMPYEDDWEIISNGLLESYTHGITDQGDTRYPKTSITIDDDQGFCVYATEEITVWEDTP